MAQPGSNGVPGPAGRKLHIAHRRSPSELTPLMSMCSPGARAAQFDATFTNRELTDSSGTTCSSATNRTTSAATAANRCHPRTIC